MLAIDISKLVKQYKNGVRALDGLNLTVRKGEIFSLLGPNSAGKSSLINILTTLYKPTSGKILIMGKDLCNEPAWVRTQIACVAQGVSIDEHLSLIENMLFQSRLYKVNAQVAKKRMNTLIEDFGLSEYANYPTSSYSGGVRRRLDIAMNMVSFPKILFLDEPTVGMDVTSRKAMWEILMKIRDVYETTIFLTTHYLEEADQLSDNICIMSHGKELIQGTPNALRHYIQQDMLRITFSYTDELEIYQDALDRTGLVKFTHMRNNAIFAGVDDRKKSFVAVNKWLLEHAIGIQGIEIVEPSLEDVFLALTGSDREEK